jgi:hypothetical protein
MPRPKSRPLFELGGQWIAIEPGRIGFFYRFWYDEGTVRTRRASLGTRDFEEAKKRLAEIVVRGAPATTETHLSNVLKTYFVTRTDHLASKDNARHAGRLMLEKWAALVKVSAINDAALYDFAKDQVAIGNSLNYVARIFSVLSAALGRADLPRRHIPIKEAAVIDKWPNLKAKPRRILFEPTDEDLARLLRQDMPQCLRRWLLNSMATAGRPMAVAELTPAQRDRAHDLIALNPAGRRQNKKFAPTVREPKAMTKWLDEWEKPKGQRAMPPTQRYCLYATRSSINTALGRACEAERPICRRWRSTVCATAPPP